MFAALSSEAEENYFVDNLNGFIALAPCILAEGNQEQSYPEGREQGTEWLDARPDFGEQFPLNNDGVSNDAFCEAAGEESGACATVRFVEAVGLG